MTITFEVTQVEALDLIDWLAYLRVISVEVATPVIMDEVEQQLLDLAYNQVDRWPPQRLGGHPSTTKEIAPWVVTK
jgi:hypothetical protein